MNDAIEMRNGERGTALVMVLLIMALLLALTMGTSLTAISENGVANTYGTQTIALQAAESGLNHAASLVMNYTGDDKDNYFTSLLRLRGANQTFPIDSTKFTSGAEMITANVSPYEGQPVPATEANGHAVRDANGNVIPGVSYSVRLIDDDPGFVPNFNPGASYAESTGQYANDPNRDNNNRIVIYSTGKYANSSVTLEGWVAFLPYPALAANYDIEVVGSSDIKGAYGGVHSNRNLTVGNAATVAQSATASGTATIANPTNVGGFSGGGQPRLDIPQFVTQPVIDPSTGKADQSPRLRSFLVQTADRILVDPNTFDGANPNDPNGNDFNGGNKATRQLRNLAQSLNINYATLAAALDSDNSNGKVDQTSPAAVAITRDPNTGVGTPTKITVASTGWGYTGGANANWGLTDTKASGHTYYVVGADNYNVNSPSLSTPNGGNVKITSNYGTPANPVKITIFATGSIEIAGNPNIISYVQKLRTPLLPPFVKVDFMLAAVEDIKINGDTDGAQRFSGISFAGEQVYLSGNGAFNGQVLALGNKNVSGSPVNTDLNTVTGSFELTLDKGNSVGRISLYTWRQIKR